MSNIFHILLYQPLFNALIFFYTYLPGKDLGVAIIILTILIKFILYPLGTKAIKSQKVLQDLQPKLNEIKEKYKNDKQAQTKATMELYKVAKINPFSGCLPIIIQLPILFALYRLFSKGLNADGLSNLYSFLPNPGVIDFSFLGIVNLAVPSVIFAVLAGVVQFVQTKMTTPKMQKAPNTQGKADFSQMMNKQMLYIFPLITVYFLWKLPAAIALYWIVNSIFSIAQQYFIFRKLNAKPQLKQN